MFRKTKARLSIKALMIRLLIAVSSLFAILCFFILIATRQILIQNAAEYTQLTAQKLQNQLDMIYDKMDVHAMNIEVDEDVQAFLVAPNSEWITYLPSIQETFANVKILESGIEDIALVNDEIHYSGIYSYDELDAIREASLGEPFRWNGTRASSFRSRAAKGKMLLYTSEIKRQGEDIGTLIISFNPSYFQFSQEEELYSSYLLANEEGVIYAFNCEDAQADAIWAQWHSERSGSKKPYSLFSRSRYMIEGNYSEKMDCWQLTAMSVENFSASMRHISLLIWFMVLLAFSFMAITFLMIMLRVVRPLQRFRSIIHKLRKSAKDARPAAEENPGGCLEIAEIGREFSAMVRETDDLNRKMMQATTDLYEAKVAKQQAELSYMRSQIDPHFLYNTLEVFRSKALERNAPEIAEMAVDMGTIFRYSTKGEDLVPLSSEISIIKAYIHIQKERFKDRFVVFYSLAEDTMDCIVAKMLLQPIAENAIRHGIEPKEDKGTLFISTRLEAGTLIITVKDDGVGIDAPTLSAIQRALDGSAYDTSEHVGLVNTHARIRLRYGQPYGVSIDSRVGDGTTVILRLPAIYEA